MGMKQHSIAIVDDCSVSRELLGSTLRGCGYHTSECGSGTQFLDLIEREPPLMVLLDICMPDINGFDLLARIRHRHPVDTLPVLVITGQGDNKDVVRALTTGANDLIVKPIDQKTFLARVYYHLNVVQIHRQHEEHRQRLMKLLTVSQAIEELRGEAIVAQDKDGRVVYCNPFIKRLAPQAESMEIHDVLRHIVPVEVLDSILRDLRKDPTRLVVQRIASPQGTRGSGVPKVWGLRSALRGEHRFWMVHFDYLEEFPFCSGLSSQPVS